MDTNILTNQNTLIMVATISAIALVSILALILSIRTKIKLRRLFRGASGHDLETVIRSMSDTLLAFERKQDFIDKKLDSIDSKVTKHVRGVGLVRFNPFPDQGGTQSFALALLNEDKDGVVVSSLYARERTSVYAKPIVKSTSTFELSEEEKEALDKAVKSM